MSGPRLRWQPAYIGIGSNLDSPRQHVQQAVADLQQLADSVVTAASSLYRSPPLGPQDQPDYVNAVSAVLTRLPPHDLLAALKDIERRHGRTPGGERWGPRELDLDLLVYGDRVIADDTLTVPHPGIRERNFVLLPLCELAPHLSIPTLGKVAQLTAAVAAPGTSIKRIGSTSP